jgi:hypothetical protein
VFPQVLARGLDKVYTLSVSTYQMSILVLFNEHGSLTVEAIAQALDLDCPEVATALYPLLKAQVCWLVGVKRGLKSCCDGDRAAWIGFVHVLWLEGALMFGFVQCARLRGCIPV